MVKKFIGAKTINAKKKSEKSKVKVISQGKGSFDLHQNQAVAAEVAAQSSLRQIQASVAAARPPGIAPAALPTPCPR